VLLIGRPKDTEAWKIKNEAWFVYCGNTMLALSITFRKEPDGWVNCYKAFLMKNENKAF